MSAGPASRTPTPHGLAGVKLLKLIELHWEIKHLESMHSHVDNELAVSGSLAVRLCRYTIAQLQGARYERV